MLPSTETLPNWVQKNPTQYLKILRQEATDVYIHLPEFGLYMENGVVYLEGSIISENQTPYLTRIVYEAEYPKRPPTAFLADVAVQEFCLLPENAHPRFPYFPNKQWGLGIWVLQATQSNERIRATNVIHALMNWIHDYEFKKRTGCWPP